MNKAPVLSALLLASLAHAQQVGREDITLNFGDFQSKAQWTYPGSTTGKLPAVLLIPGSTPADMDFHVYGADGTLKSSIFKDLADGLATRGVATLRYNKHYVSGPRQVDAQKFYTQADLGMFLRDAETALQAVEQNPRVDPRRVFVYGWSEGSTVAAALAARHPELAGLILQGPVVLPWRQLFEAQFNTVQLPYLRSVVGDTLTNDGLIKLLTGQGGLVAKSVAAYFADQTQAQQGKFVINSALDTDKDGRLEVNTEVVPGFKAVLDSAFTPQGVFRIYAPGRALPTVTAQVPNLKLPVLVLQGQDDASTPVGNLGTLEAAFQKAGTRATVKVYPGLGHTLGPARSEIDDDFRPIAAQPMQDTINWIKAR
ncbi:alpha/beta hydrolase family protein [Deinococcus planocerae]|uniref:alpha/beta hydrolase family protein n=1 Tax=Deinococcus planocerae TaxID=1737569 RepID=UPI000C7F425E|nr:alpha/beta fold hydrolase [Deinococcus planocerae]